MLVQGEALSPKAGGVALIFLWPFALPLLLLEFKNIIWLKYNYKIHIQIQMWIQIQRRSGFDLSLTIRLPFPCFSSCLSSRILYQKTNIYEYKYKYKYKYNKNEKEEWLWSFSDHLPCFSYCFNSIMWWWYDMIWYDMMMIWWWYDDMTIVWWSVWSGPLGFSSVPFAIIIHYHF